MAWHSLQPNWEKLPYAMLIWLLLSGTCSLDLQSHKTATEDEYTTQVSKEDVLGPNKV